VDVRFLNPFVESVFVVLEAELGISAERGDLSLISSAYTTDEITVLVNLSGQVQGMVMYGMSESMALEMVSRILGDRFEHLDDLAQSGIGELGNVITGQASIRLSEAGYESTLSPPKVITQKSAMVSKVDFNRILVPVKTEIGDLRIHIALHANSS
jgi:chemotaxis protein CheX